MARQLANPSVSRPVRGTPSSAPTSEDILERAGLTRSWVAMLLGMASMATVVLAVYIDGFGAVFSDPDFWRRNVGQPVIIAYGLMAHHFLDTYGRRAILAFRPLVRLDDRSFDRIVESERIAAIKYQPYTMFAGALAGAELVRIWDWHFGFTWNALVIKITAIGLYAIIASYLYLAIRRHRLFTRLFSEPLSIDVFNLAPLRPIARWGLVISLAVVGGVTIGMLTVDKPEVILLPDDIAVYGGLTVAAVALFFASLFSTHQVMQQAKEEELRAVRTRLSGTYRAMKDLPEEQLQTVDGLSDSIASWLAYEKRIMEAPEWPYTAGTLRGLFASVLLPLVATLFQQFLFTR